MLADVDCVLVGAGIPRALPGVLDRFAAGLPASLKIDVAQETPGAHPPVCTELDPGAFTGRPARLLRRPQFLAIVSSSAVATALARTAFAFCEESGLDPEYKMKIVALSLAGAAGVFTDPRASPTGMPFKVVPVPGTLSEADVYEARTRRCDLGYLRQPYRRKDGSLGYRCAGEPRDEYLRKEGDLAETEGRKCLCNGLLSAVGLGQRLGDGTVEPAIFTAGEEVRRLVQYCAPGQTSYSVADVLRWMSTEASNPPIG